MFPCNASKRTGVNKRKRVGSAVCFNNYKHENSVTYEDKHLKVNDRRISSTFVEETVNPVGMYELLKMWVQDDPAKCLKVSDSSVCKSINGVSSAKLGDEKPIGVSTAIGVTDSDPPPADQEATRSVNVDSALNSDPSELLKEHVLKFKTIKERQVEASMVRVDAAVAVINTLRPARPDSE